MLFLAKPFDNEYFYKYAGYSGNRIKSFSSSIKKPFLMFVKRISLITTIILISCQFSFSQESKNVDDMISQIETIVSEQNIYKGSAKIQYIKDPFTKSATLCSKEIFHFEGQFLVMDDLYINMQKLLYFRIKKNYIEFYFEGA